ncbi:MAG: hypothetical protein KBT14_01445, partial [Proteobacteria bacterium]|nr:hypothetical protein [Candidatus Enterousia onthequi]
LRKSKEKSKYRESKKMHKKHMFLRVFSKITIFACVFCAFPAWSDTTTCDINYTPVTGNSWQNGTPTPTNPVAIESVGTKIGNKYQISVTAQGKNLFDDSVAKIGYLINDSGIEKADGQSGCSGEFINVKPNTSYTYAIIGTVSSNAYYPRIHFYNANKQWIKMSIKGGSGAKHLTTTTESDTAYIKVSGTADVDKVMVVEGSTAPTSYAPYSAPITTPIYLNAPLRKVGDYADVLDYKNGTITRNVGVKVLDGTESWADYTYAGAPLSFYISINDMIETSAATTGNNFSTTHFSWANSVWANSNIGYAVSTLKRMFFRKNTTDTLDIWKAYLAQQYANGTPVTIYYPLATPVVEQIENWSCTPPITDIKIATTKMVDDEFKAAEAKLATTVQTIESVVSRTIAQTGQIQILQDTKQTRPDESCPANMKCLLVQDEDGTPHWYPIIEP